MGSKNMGMLVALVGLIVVVVFLLADVLGIGSGNGFNLSDMGARQIIGIVVGIVLLVGGAVIYMRPTAE